MDDATRGEVVGERAVQELRRRIAARGAGDALRALRREIRERRGVEALVGRLVLLVREGLGLTALARA